MVNLKDRGPFRKIHQANVPFDLQSKHDENFANVDDIMWTNSSPMAILTLICAVTSVLRVVLEFGMCAENIQ